MSHHSAEMRRLVVILVLVAYVTARPHKGRIYGGQDASSGQFPFIVAFNDEFGQYCDGVIVAPSWILTSARCLLYHLPSTEVYVGSHLNLVNGTAFKMAERIPHPEYDVVTFQNDIGLVKIEGELTYSETIQQIEFGEPSEPNATCTAMGWGSTLTETFPDNLQYVELVILDMDTCQNISANYLDGGYLGSEQVCALGDLDQGSCFGDGGGPLVCDGKLAGVSSYQIWGGCGAGLPEVYTEPSAYAAWIQKHIQA